MSTNQKDIWMYYDSLRGITTPDHMLEGLMLAAETKSANANGNLSSEAAYDEMVILADKFRVLNPFPDKETFYRVYEQIDDEPDWEQMLYQHEMHSRSYAMLVPDALMEKMTSHITEDTKTVLIAEGEKFVPNLKAVVDHYPACLFTITSENDLFANILGRIFEGYTNVQVVTTNIYEYGFINEKFDLILSVPTFGVRDLAEDSKNFMCRETDMVALENLLLHISGTGELVIVMPGRISFAGGNVNDLRNFVMSMYSLRELSSLPDGIFQNTGIRTYLIVIGSGRTEDVVVRRYEAEGRKTKRGPVHEMKPAEDTFAMKEELEEIGDWNIDKILTQQGEEFMRYQASDVMKVPLGELAEIFRGKAVPKKDVVDAGSIGVINISNIGKYELDYENIDKIEDEERKVQTYILKEGDVLLPARGTAIRSAIFHEQSYPCIASSNVIVIRPDQKKLNSTYLKIFLDSPIGGKMISSLQQGMTVMNISYKDLKILEVPTPAIEDQGKVSEKYQAAYAEYTKTISEAEKKWLHTLDELQKY